MKLIIEGNHIYFEEAKDSYDNQEMVAEAESKLWKKIADLQGKRNGQYDLLELIGRFRDSFELESVTIEDETGKEVLKIN